MTGSTEVYSHALGLPLPQREELALLLLDSLPGDNDAPVEVGEDLKREIDRRIAERKAGAAKAIDMDTFIARVRAAAQEPVTK